jgi:hypothetical protein
VQARPETASTPTLVFWRRLADYVWGWPSGTCPSSTRPWEIERHARIGASFGGEPARGQRPWAAAVDADLTRTAVPGGERRSLAAGAERWSANRRFALRGGGRVQTVGDLRPAASGGASVAIRSGVLIETQATGGSDAADRGWSVAARLTF